jgi:hypothetical protein
MDDSDTKQLIEEHDDGLEWVWRAPDNTYRTIPKTPLLLGGLGPPPFTVRLPDGTPREIVHRPSAA